MYKILMDLNISNIYFFFISSLTLSSLGMNYSFYLKIIEQRMDHKKTFNKFIILLNIWKY